MTLLLFTFILTISTFIHTTSSTFFKFVLLVAVGQAATSAYLQISVIAIASLFGPTAVQAMMSGQAAVAVAVSAVQLVSSAISLSGEDGKPSVTSVRSTPDETSAFVFFAFSSAFLGGTVFAHRVLIRMPVYKSSVQPLNPDTLSNIGGTGERQTLLASHVREDSKLSQETNQARIFRVAKANILYEVAIAYVFVVTLVRVGSPEL
jgi:equilibrative nucleoside transporter 1/2/3